MQPVAIVDYGLGNLPSVQKALERVGCPGVVTQAAGVIAEAPGVVLPGVGAFPRAMENLERLGLVPILKQAATSGRPFLGICLGMQLLFTASDEWRDTPGLGIIPGRVTRLPATRKLPHIGWNTVTPLPYTADRGPFSPEGSVHPLLAGLPTPFYAYFVHTFAAMPDHPGDVVATTGYGRTFAAVAARGGAVGVQFHPEKSSRLGLAILANFGKAVQAHVHGN